MGLIFENGWWTARYVDASGKRRRQRLSRDERQARETFTLLQGEEIRNRLLDIDPIQHVYFEVVAEKFIEHAKVNVRAWRRYQSSLRSLVPFFEKRWFHRIRAEDVEDYKILRSGDVSHATINRDLQCLKRLFNLGVDWGYARNNPVKKVKFLRESSGRLRYLTREEFQRLLLACPHQLRYVVHCAAYTGMRQRELLDLTWTMVDLENGFASVNDPKNGVPRKVALNASVREVLREVKSLGWGEKVFCNGPGQDYPSRTLQCQFTKAMQAAGVKEFRFHDLRHTCASWLAIAGVPALTIKEVLGHRDIRMTTRYAHLAPDQTLDAVNRLDRFVKNGPPREQMGPLRGSASP